MQKEVSLTQEEVEAIKKVRVDYNKYLFEMGQLHTELHKQKKILKLLEDEENKLLSDLDKIQEAENSLRNNLVDKYGEGAIDLESGKYIKD